MELDDLKDMIKEDYPLTWKATKAWMIRNKDTYEWGLKFRNKLYDMGYDEISDEDNISESLQEIEEDLIKDEV